MITPQVTINFTCHPAEVAGMLRAMLSDFECNAPKARADAQSTSRETFTGYPAQVVEPRRAVVTAQDANESYREDTDAYLTADDVGDGAPAAEAVADGKKAAPRAKRATKAEMEARKQAAAEAALADGGEKYTPDDEENPDLAAEWAGEKIAAGKGETPAADGVTYAFTDSVLRELVMVQNGRVGAPLLKAVNDFLGEVRERMTAGGEAKAAGELKNMLGLSAVDREALVTKILDLPNLTRADGTPGVSEKVIADVTAKTQALLDAAVKL